MANENVAIAERFTQAVYAGDQDTMRSLLDATFVIEQDRALPYGGVYKRADGFLAFLGKFSQAFEIESLDKTRTFVSDADPNNVVFEFAFRGKLKNSDVKFNTSLLEHWRFRDGKIVAIRPHWFEIPGSSTKP